jgi:hypothetical protein
VKARLEDHDVVAIDEVDEAVLVGDAPRPRAGQRVLELLRFAYAGERIVQHVVNEPVDRLRIARSAVCQCV